MLIMLRHSLAKLVLAAGLATVAGSVGAQENSRTAALVDGHGRGETAKVCTLCHSAAEFAGERLTRTGWALVISSMIDEYGMPEPDPAVRDIVLTYLSTQFGSQAD